MASTERQRWGLSRASGIPDPFIRASGTRHPLNPGETRQNARDTGAIRLRDRQAERDWSFMRRGAVIRRGPQITRESRPSNSMVSHALWSPSSVQPGHPIEYIITVKGAKMKQVPQPRRRHALHAIALCGTLLVACGDGATDAGGDGATEVNSITDLAGRWEATESSSP